MSPFTAELLGTMILILLGNGVVANVVLKDTKGNNGGWIVITVGWGFAVFTGVVISAATSGAHLNPAVSIGLALAGEFPWSQVPIYMIAQLLGAALGTTFVWLIYRDHYTATEDQGAKLATFCTGPAIRNSFSNFLSEAIGTFVLIFAVLFIEGPKLMPMDPDTPAGLGSLGALPVALIVMVIGLSLGGTTGYAINPARDLAPRFMHQILPITGKGTSDWGYAWIPISGPIFGAAVASFLYLTVS